MPTNNTIMGNHIVGKMFNAGVSVMSDEEIDSLSPEKAFEIIDRIGKEVVATTSLDAEFDDFINPDQKLGRVLIKAYLPHKYEEWRGKPFVDEEMDDEWYYKLYRPFRDRFGFF